VPAFKIEGACASGGLAMHNAVNAVASGQYATVLVLGIEKMTDHRPEDVATALMGAGSQEERAAGATFPGLYAMLARAHMKAYGTTPEDLARVAVKNHRHAMHNPNAQFHTQITVKDVLKSSMIADPLHLLDCSPISDGAAAVIVTSTTQKAVSTNAVRIAASTVATDTLGLAQRKSLTELAATRRAAKAAYAQAGVTARDIDVVELHDCFTIAEILALQDLGLKQSHAVINPSGGLKGCGHPVGATGVKQIAELTEHLRGTAGDRQVAGARIGLAQNVGGSGGTAVVHILQSESI
jgi:acetyl-CoA C-acetyltransferase